MPQGARPFGQYDSRVAYGHRRVLLVWTRLIRQDGQSLVLDRLPAADVAGQSGREDRVDWRWRRIFAGAALSTLIGVGAELAAPIVWTPAAVPSSPYARARRTPSIRLASRSRGVASTCSRR